MELELKDFSSIIEVFTAINFAYVYSDGFTQYVETYFSKNKKHLEDKVNKIRSSLLIIHNNLQLIPTYNITINSNPIDLSNHNTNCNNYETKLNEILSEIDKINKEKSYLQFYPLCLISGIFCMIILFTAPIINFLNIFILLVSTFLFLFNILNALTMLRLINKTEFCRKIASMISNIKYSFNIFLTVLGISFIINFVFKNNSITSYFNIDISILYTIIKHELYIFFIVLIPILHFIVYFFHVKRLGNIKYKKPISELNKLIKESDKTNEDLNLFVKVGLENRSLD